MPYVVKYFTGTIWEEKAGILFKDRVEELNHYEECTLVMPNEPDYRAFVTEYPERRLRVYYNNDIIFDGLFTTVKYRENVIEWTGYSTPFIKLKYATYTGDHSESGIPLNQLLEAICTPVGVYVECSITTTIKAKYKYNYAWEIIQSLAKIANCDFWTYYYGTQPRLVFGNKGSLHTDVEIVGVNETTKDSSNKITKVVGLGMDAEGNEITVTVGSGDKVYVFYESEVTNQTALEAKAQKELNELNKDYVSSKIILRPDTSYFMKTGDFIRINKPRLGLNGDYRIYKLRHSPDRVEVDIERVSLTISGIVRDLNRVKSYMTSTYDRQTTYSDIIPQIPTFTAEAKEVDTANEFKTWISVTVNRVDKALGYYVEYCKSDASGNPVDEPQTLRLPQLDSPTITGSTPELLPNQYYYVRVGSISMRCR